MKVNIAKIKLGNGLTTKFTLEEKPSDFSFEGEEIHFITPLRVNGEITNAGGMFPVKGNLETVLRLNCSRCLEQFEYPINVEFNSIFAQEAPVADDSDDVRIFTGDEIMLDDVVMEALILELPLKFLCKQECKGLCPQCGHNLNKATCNCEKPVDPRFGILAELLKEAEDKSKGV